MPPSVVRLPDQCRLMESKPCTLRGVGFATNRADKVDGTITSDCGRTGASYPASRGILKQVGEDA